MASDWIKMRTDLYRDPKVCVIADFLMDPKGALARYVNQNNQSDMCVTRNVMRNVTVGSLVSVWGVMRQRGKRQGIDLVCTGVTLDVIDDIAEIHGFGEAMNLVGWAVETDGLVTFPRFFEDYNVSIDGVSTGSSAERQRRYRERKKQNDTVMRDVTCDVTVPPRVEKSREEKKEQKENVAAVADLFPGLPSKLVADFKKLRAAKRSPITQTAVDGIKREAAKAGMTLQQAVEMCCERGWASLKADWLTGSTPQTPSGPVGSSVASSRPL